MFIGRLASAIAGLAIIGATFVAPGHHADALGERSGTPSLTALEIIGDAVNKQWLEAQEEVDWPDGFAGSGWLGHDWYACKQRTDESTTVPTGCKRIPNATSSSYRIATKDIGKYLAVFRYFYWRNDYSPDVTELYTVFSQSTDRVSKTYIAPRNTRLPTLHSAAIVRPGDPVDINPGEWLGVPTPEITYRWFRCSSTPPTKIKTLPADCHPLWNQTALSAGGQFACSIQEGAVRCWGRNDYGQLGQGFQGSDEPVAMEVVGIEGATSVSSAYSHSCAVISGGSLQCWGYGWGGELAPGYSTEVGATFRINGITNAIDVGVGGGGSCVVLSTGSIKCWGDGWDGQLGNGSWSDSNSPVTVSAITNASKVEMGNQHACALLLTGAVKCWGLAYQGRLGNGSSWESNTPVATGITNATDIAVSDDHSCALIVDGTVKCWGVGSWGQIGNGAISAAMTPNTVGGLSGATAIDTAYGYSCAIYGAGGTVRCWGYGSDGQIGNGSTNVVNAQSDVLTGATQISTGGNFACATTDEAFVYCWGGNGYLQLGSEYQDYYQSSSPIMATAGSWTGTQIDVFSALEGEYLLCEVTAENSRGSAVKYAAMRTAVQP